jgi:hypothetical protein
MPVGSHQVTTSERPRPPVSNAGHCWRMRRATPDAPYRVVQGPHNIGQTDASFKPATPAMIASAETNFDTLSGSFSSSMPRMTVPSVPTAVQIG